MYQEMLVCNGDPGDPQPNNGDVWGDLSLQQGHRSPWKEVNQPEGYISGPWSIKWRELEPIAYLTLLPGHDPRV